ncbi:MAG: tetratricopeptide repeat protein [Bacteroidetes bacterium]|nr:MAG: tetratricopeptide repeat protein [Bacteroidota bacterium]
MRNGLLLVVLWQAFVCTTIQAQIEVVRYFHPVFSPTHTENATGERGVLRALVVGIDRYQHGRFATRNYARRDAEAFAAFLKTPAGGSINGADLALRTNEQATLAEVTDALNWMVEESKLGDKIIIFLSLYGYMNPKAETRLIFYDSPAAPIDAGYMPLSQLTEALGKAATQNNARIFLAIDLQPGKPDTEMLQRWPKSERRWSLQTEKLLFPGKRAAGDTLLAAPTFGNTLLKGLMGLADYNLDEKVFVPELKSYLQGESIAPAPGANCAYLAISDPKDWLCSPANRSREKVSRQVQYSGTPILQMEVQPLDDFMAKLDDPSILRMYEDFILAIRLGQLLTPPEYCASTLLDSLLQIPDLAPVYRTLQRRMAVGYQDEAQQAINAYLQTSAHELSRRRKDPDHYKRYAEYIRRTQGILGEAHFMANLLELKRLYFEALELRLEFDRDNDSLLLPQALAKLQQAIEIEPEAAFVYNEMGVVMALSEKYDTAIYYFNMALERAPTWGIPLSNLGYTLNEKGDSVAAKEAAIQGISLNSWNPNSYIVLGLILLDNGDLENASDMFRRALLIDPEIPDAHYNLACAKAKEGKIADAVEALRLAIRYGFNKTETFIREDKDLTTLHGTPAFESLMETSFIKK